MNYQLCGIQINNDTK